MRKSAPEESLRQEEEGEIEYAGLRDVAPYLGLKLPPAILGKEAERVEHDLLAGKFAQIEIKRRERSNGESRLQNRRKIADVFHG